MNVGRASLMGNPNFDPGHLFISAVPYMLDSARAAANKDAHSYRDFKVGAAVFAVNPGIQDTGIQAAGNLKSQPHKAKVCAERKVLDQARKAGYTTATGILVVGTTDSELIKEVTGVATPTLHPCVECQGMFHDHPLMRDDTIIITTGLEQGDDIYQVHTNSQLHDMYAPVDVEALERERHNSGFDDWPSRVAMYDYISLAERQLPESERRATSFLLQLALTAN